MLCLDIDVYCKSWINLWAVVAAYCAVTAYRASPRIAPSPRDAQKLYCLPLPYLKFAIIGGKEKEKENIWRKSVVNLLSIYYRFISSIRGPRQNMLLLWFFFQYGWFVEVTTIKSPSSGTSATTFIKMTHFINFYRSKRARTLPFLKCPLM